MYVDDAENIFPGSVGQKKKKYTLNILNAVNIQTLALINQCDK